MIAPNEYDPNKMKGIIGGIDTLENAKVIIFDSLNNMATAIANTD